MFPVLLLGLALPFVPGSLSEPKAQFVPPPPPLPPPPIHHTPAHDRNPPPIFPTPDGRSLHSSHHRPEPHQNQNSILILIKGILWLREQTAANFSEAFGNITELRNFTTFLGSRGLVLNATFVAYRNVTDAKLMSLMDDSTSLTTRVTALENNMTSGPMSNITDRVQALENQTATQNVINTQILTMLELFMNTTAELTNRITALENTTTTQATQLETLQNSTTALETRVTALENQNSTAGDNSTVDIPANLTERLTTLESTAANLTTDVTSLTNTASGLQSNVTELNNQTSFLLDGCSTRNADRTASETQWYYDDAEDACFVVPDQTAFETFVGAKARCQMLGDGVDLATFQTIRGYNNLRDSCTHGNLRTNLTDVRCWIDIRIEGTEGDRANVDSLEFEDGTLVPSWLTTSQAFQDNQIGCVSLTNQDGRTSADGEVGIRDGIVNFGECGGMTDNVALAICRGSPDPVAS